MSISSQITRLQNAKANIKTAIENKGVTVPSATKLDGYPALIDSIESGSRLEQDMEDLLLMGVASSNFFYGEYSNSEITSIGGSVFYSCTSLTSVNFPICTDIGNYAFYDCSSLTSVSFPMCTSIGVFAFGNCASLTSVSFPMCTSIGANAFGNCASLISVSFPKCSVIGDYAFQNCGSLTSVSFPMCTYISGGAFAGCMSLTSVSFPMCIVIGYFAFAACLGLTSVSFPMCTYIGETAFMNCAMLKSFYIGTSNCVLAASTAFEGAGGRTLSIYVPTAYVTKYKSSTNWSYFSSRIVGY